MELTTGLCLAAAAVTAFFALLDGWYLLRVPLTLLHAHCCLPRVRDLLAEDTTFPSRVLLTDLDCLLHMNNARYPREADLARGAHLTRCGLMGAMRALGAHAVLAATACRFRRSLRPLERFGIRTRLLGWDERAFFLEQRFVRARDGFVCAVLHVRQHVVGATPARLVEHVCRRKVESPELPEEVLHWVKYNEISSQKLRAENNLQEKGKDQ